MLGPQCSSFFVSNSNTFLFLGYPGKFWTDLSEITAPLHPNLFIYSLLKEKRRVQLWVQSGCRWVQKGCGKTAVCPSAPGEFSSVFKGLCLRVQRCSSKDCPQTDFSARSAQAVLSRGYRKSRFLLLFLQSVFGVNRYIQIGDLGFPCDCSRLATLSRRVENRRNTDGMRTAFSWNMRGYGLWWSKEINRLASPDLQKCAVIFGSPRAGVAWRTLPPPEKWANDQRPRPPLLSINWSYFPRLFSHSFRCSSFTWFKNILGLVFAVLSEGGAGGTC